MTGGQDTWSARCVETRTAGAAGGPGKPTGSNPGRAPWSDPTGRFYRSQLYPLLRRVNTYLMRWAGKKYKRLRACKRFTRWWSGVTEREPRLFAHRAWTRELAGLR
jgi:RNA-directed DNA polymerase